MKNLTLLFLLFFAKIIHCQTIFWQENFGIGCNQGGLAASISTPSNGLWSIVNTGVQGPQANEWFISATEAGRPMGNCGDGCLNNPGMTNKTLHISSNIAPPFTDPAAVYLQNANSTTNKRVESPLINCTGKNNIVFSFNYIANGVFGTDFAEAMYSNNGGTSYTVLGLIAPSMGTCAPQGLWTPQSFTLPATADGNPNVKVAFRWENGPAVGPGKVSVAIDEITLSEQSLVGIRPNHVNDIQINLFPNPVKDKLTLDFANNIINKIIITNSLGQIVFELNDPVSKREFELNFLKAGIYFLKTESLTKQKVFKFIKE